MPSFPPPGAVTICEINRDLGVLSPLPAPPLSAVSKLIPSLCVAVAADAVSDDRAKDAYGDVLGMVFSPIPFQPDAIVATHEPPAATEAAEPAEIVPRTSLASTIAESFKQMIFPSCDPNLLQEIDTQKVSWNPHKHCLAFVSGKNQVTVHDFEEPDNKESYILTSDHQKDVKAVEWRPNSGKMIAVGCNDGTFHLWETNTWTSEPWSSSNGYVSGANWDPEGRIVLLSFSNSTTLGSIHFSSKPPSLDAHLLPVEHPEISSLIVSRGIDKLAWDSSGERLALSFKDGNEMYHGLVAVYDVRRSPLVSVLLVAGAVAGVVRIPSYFARIDSLKGVSKVKR
ncbi:hypothetical protein OsJ_32832 [Oryza sativa Japonica Group]|uniref:Anaphase-promoting complex subunit 4-like WD40 domain-containing protein n=1 Tax=Oryza sativa subsp. japonica TaxID=39947 RepID=A3C896_ORYSJ|nr:hypothetical protein OsJ_32832 [Oryza sativa Japonica Group]